jgi:hypothetical protein
MVGLLLQMAGTTFIVGVWFTGGTVALYLFFSFSV